MLKLMRFIITVFILFGLMGCGGSGNDGNTNNSKDQNIITSISYYNSSDNSKSNKINETNFYGAEPLEQYQWNLDKNTTEVIETQKLFKLTGKNTTIAIIDSCFDTTKADLLGMQIVGTYNSSNHDTNVSCGNNDITHGEFVLGILASQINGLGIRGIAPNAKYILIKIPSIASYKNINDAFKYAIDNKANIISCSWSIFKRDKEAKAFQMAHDNNITVVFAAGNQNKDVSELPNIECNDPNVICVGATDEYNTLASYSNFGYPVMVVAPAGSMNFGVPTLMLEPTRSEIPNVLPGWTNIPTYQYKYVSGNSDYIYFNGTSASTPIVAGIISLLFEKNGVMTPNYTKLCLQNYGITTFDGYNLINAKKLIEKCQ